jgi:hypothetical protein
MKFKTFPVINMFFITGRTLNYIILHWCNEAEIPLAINPTRPAMGGFPAG